MSASRLPALLNEEDDIDELEILPVSDLEFREEAMVVEYCQGQGSERKGCWATCVHPCSAGKLSTCEVFLLPREIVILGRIG